MHFSEASSGLTKSPSAYISRNPSMMREQAFHIASVMGLPSYSTDSFSAEHVAQKQPARAHRLQSSQKHVLYLQVLENGIHCQHKNQGISHRNLCSWLLTKFSSGNPGSVFSHGKNQLVWGGAPCLDWTTALPRPQASTDQLPGSGRHLNLWPVRLYQRAMICVTQV